MPTIRQARGLSGLLTRRTTKQSKPVIYASIDDALVANHLDWTVTKRPLFARIPHEQDPAHGVMKRADNLFGIVRSDTNATLGAATGRYETISNHEAFAPLGECASKEGIKIVGAREIDGGKLVAIQALPADPLYIAGDEIRPYMLFTTKHDGTGRMRGFSAPERFACLNQLRRLIFGEGVEIAISHTRSAKDRLEDARRLIRAAFNGQEQFVRTAEDLLAQTFTRVEFENLANMLLPKPDESSPTTTQRMLTNWESRFEALMQQAYMADDLNDVRYTAWGAVNAVADYEQHLQPIRAGIGELDTALFKRAMFNGDMTAQALAILRPN